MNTQPKHMKGVLHLGETHPAVPLALQWLRSRTGGEIRIWREKLAAVALEGNRLAEVCSTTLEQLLNHQQVGDRYLLGLVLAMIFGDDDETSH